LLTLLGASIVGILPGLRVTRPGIQDALRNESAARSGLRFGGFWTGVIVVQVAITVAFLPLAAGGALEASRFQMRAAGVDAEQFLSARIAMDRENFSSDSAAFVGRTRTAYQELERRLYAIPGVERVAFADRLPVMDQFKYSIQVDTMLSGAPREGIRRTTGVFVAPAQFRPERLRKRPGCHR
jgi:hypothetical protein